MAYSYVVYTGNGSITQFAITFPYIRKEHVKVYVNYVDTAYTYVNDTTVQLAAAPASPLRVEVRRVTPLSTRLVDYTDGSTLVAADLDTSSLQSLYNEQELDDNLKQTVSIDPATGLPSAGGQRITNVGNPTSAQDAATKTYVDTADALKVNKAGDTMSGALAMGTNKITGLGNPTSAQDGATKTYVDTADALKVAKAGDTMSGALAMGTNKITGMGDPTSAQDAATKTYVDTADALKVNKAGDSMTGPLAMGTNKITNLGTPTVSTDAVTKAYIDAYINTAYLGPLASDPATRPSGGSLQIGDQYFNTTQNIVKAWTGTVWVISAAAGNIIRWRKTASAGNTTLSGTDDLSVTLSYVVGNEQVYLNGALQTRGVDYTAATGNSITFTPALLAGDVVELHAVQGYVSATITPGSINDALVAPAAGIQATKLAFTQAGTGATTRTIDSKLKDTIHVKDFGAVGDGTTDDTAALQAAITAAAGKTLIFDAVTYKTTSTLTISSHGTKLYCRDATIDYYGTAAAIGFGLVGGTIYPVEVEFHNLNINVNSGPSSVGIQVRTSYSRYYDVGILLKSGATSAKGFVLVGDEANGSGPYYNLFQGCVVQSQSSGTDHTGFQCATQAPLYRAPNANTWIGGRIGQCATGFLIAGGGNTFFHPTVENAPATGVAFDFVGPNASNCTQNNVIGGYVENASIAFRFNSLTNGNGIFNPYITGASTFISDAGTENLYITSNAPSRLSTGVKLGTLSSDASVLDYYEEGTWTPTLVGATTAGSYTLTTTTAKYTRIGRLVHVSAYMTITINSAGSGAARFGGLPFAKGSATIISGSVFLTNFTLPAGNSGVAVSHWTSSPDSTFYLVATRSATSPYDIVCSDINSGANVVANFTYTV